MKKYAQAVQAYHFKCSVLALETLPIFCSMNSQPSRVKEQIGSSGILNKT